MAQSKDLPREPVTTVFSWTVKDGKEEQFEHIMHDVHQVARTFPGHMGVTILESPAEKRKFQTILRFDTATHLDAWMNSPIRKKMVKLMEQIAQEDVVAKASGLETWFTIPGEHVTPLPKWKMTTTTFIAIYPLSLLFTIFLTPHIESLPVVIRALFLPIIAPTVLTYFFMPFLTQRILKRWLYKTPAS